MRVQSLELLTRLMMVSMPDFRRYLRRSFIGQSLQDVIDFLHALLGYCIEPTALLASPQGAGQSGKVSSKHGSHYYTWESYVFKSFCSNMCIVAKLWHDFTYEGLFKKYLLTITTHLEF